MGFQPDNLAHAPHGGPTESYKAFNLSRSAKYSLRLQVRNSTLSPRMATFKYGLSLQYILIGIGSGSCCCMVACRSTLSTLKLDQGRW